MHPYTAYRAAQRVASTLPAWWISSPEFYHPLGTPSLTSAICLELELQPLISLGPEIPRFQGSGLYAIYHSGDSLPLYVPLTGYDIPVYADQALSHNSATGRTTGRPDPLWHPVRDHRRSIASADLPLDEFAVRLLRLPDVHADLGENGQRVLYQPVWNSVLTGSATTSRARQPGRANALSGTPSTLAAVAPTVPTTTIPTRSRGRPPPTSPAAGTL